MLASAILKLTAFCNIDCKYCYMFNLADQTHKRVPHQMELATASKVLDRICEYCDTNSTESFSIVLHGGEPTLWPERNIVTWLNQVQARRDQGFKFDLALQSNLVRPLSAQWCELLREHRISLGISIDGPKESNDAYRVDFRGRGTYDRVMANVFRLLDGGHHDLIGGFLSVANPVIPADKFFAWLLTLPVTKVDVLWPIQFNWNNPPWTVFPRQQYALNPRYGAWFGRLFDLWWQCDDPDIQVRLFNNLVTLAVGGHDHADMLVNDTMNMFVVNTDGAFEYPDYLRNAADGSAQTGLCVQDNSLTELADTVGFRKLLRLSDQLPEHCRTCRHHGVCGGGFLAGRADAVNVVSPRESVLCDDQMYFFDIALGKIGAAIAHRNHREHDTILPRAAVVT